MYASSVLAVVEQAAAGALPVLAALERDGTPLTSSRKLPAVGAIVVLMYAAIGRVAESFATLEQIPPGRAYDTARLMLAMTATTPTLPLPRSPGTCSTPSSPAGCTRRGQIGELQRITSTTLAGLSGVPDIADRGVNVRIGVLDESTRTHPRAVSGAISRPPRR